MFRALAGRITYPKLMARGLGDKHVGVDAERDWVTERRGPKPPEAVVQACEMASVLVAGACGIPASLVSVRAADGTAQRESYRRFLAAAIVPLGRLVAAELRRVLEVDVAFHWDELQAAETAGRARAWRALVGRDGSMPDPDARRLTGLT